MRREGGSALIITVMLLLLLGVIGLSALDTVTRDQQVAGFQNRSTAAFYVAEAGLAQAKDEVRRNGNFTGLGEQLAFATEAAPSQFGDASLYPHGRPKYYGDPDHPAIEAAMAMRTPGAGGSNLQMGGSFGFAAPYQIRIVGETADGAKARLEAVVLKPISAGYR